LAQAARLRRSIGAEVVQRAIFLARTRKDAMVLLSKTDTLGTFDGMRWQTVEQDVLFEVQKYQLGDPGKMLRSVFVGSKVKDFRLVSKGQKPVEIATADSLDEIQSDADLLRLLVVGVAPEGGAASVPPAVRQALVEGAAQLRSELPPGGAQEDVAMANNGGAGDTSMATAVTQWTRPELITQLEPWAVRLLENADRLRYVCYAFKVASTLGAEGATGGVAGEEVVSLTFAGVDALLVSSWLSWFLKSLNDDAPGTNVVKEVVALDFAGGPEAVLERVDTICEAMTPEDVEHITSMAMVLKRRLAVVVGDIVSLMVPNDVGITGTVITELLIRMQPKDAEDMLRRLMDLYGLIPASNRTVLENREQLHELLESSTGRLRDAIMEEYDQPSGQKLKHAATRSAKLTAAMLIPPLGPVMATMNMANLVGSTATFTNTGRDSCSQVFSTLEQNMPLIVATIQRSLGMSFGVLVLLARCADRHALTQQASAQQATARQAS